MQKHMKRSDTMAGRPLDEDTTIMVLIESCVEEVLGLDKLEAVRYMMCSDIRDDVVTCVVLRTRVPAGVRRGRPFK